MRRVERSPAAILAADMVGYSPFIGADEQALPTRAGRQWRELIESKIAEHRGRIVKKSHGSKGEAEFSGASRDSSF